MSLVAVNSPNHSLEKCSIPPATQIVRLPFYWTSRGEPLFGWWHTNGSCRHGDHAVVIAAPIGYEQVHAHRSLRHLADALAGSGLPALRFDWHGTGDSAGLDEDPDRWNVWQGNLRDAVEMVKRQFGILHVSVIGLRLGATLAAKCFGFDEIENLVLWAPVITGKTYVREMTAIDRTSEIPHRHLPGEPNDWEPSGFVLSDETAKILSDITLLQSPTPPCPTLILSRDDLKGDKTLVESYLAAGIAVDHITFSGYPEMMISPHRGDVPREAISQIVGWLSDHVTSFLCRTAPVEPSIASAKEMVARYQPEGRSQALTGASLRERAVHISASPDLFGILSEPLTPPAADRPTVVLLNAGATYRVGPGRLNVHLARRLAADGFRCLRIDANGLGDSVAAAGIPENQSYSATILRDIDLTLQFLRSQGLGRRFVLMGLCSGAYHAFQSAVALTDPTLIESVLINPLTFFWKDGMVITESTDRQVVVQQYYLESALNPRKWLKLFSGRTKIGFRGAAQIFGAWLGLVLGRRTKAKPCGIELARPPHSHPVCDDLPADLQQMVLHDRRVSMFFAKSDPGYRILVHKAGRNVKRLQRTGRLHLEFIAHADHNFSRRMARRDLFMAIASHLSSRYGSR